MSIRSTIPVTVALSQDESTATIRIGGRSTPIVAPVLGTDRDGNRVTTVYLASRIHSGKAEEYEGWDMTGAVSTILTRIVNDQVAGKVTNNVYDQ